MTPHDVPFFVDNGAFTDSFEWESWFDALEKAKVEMPRLPDFIVWPDVHGDAEATFELCDRLFNVELNREGRALLARRRDFDRFIALHPGLPLDEQFDRALSLGADGVFVGGPSRWQRSRGAEIVRRAKDVGCRGVKETSRLRVHLGNPGSAEGLVWAYRVGFDSVDTTSIFQNQSWGWLEALEAATDETHTPTPDTAQAELGAWST
ncbi:hypothetical protein [Halocalculus aciditolerans]|nr:hypothetical protein [Halocalculus aciditolerans]